MPRRNNAQAPAAVETEAAVEEVAEQTDPLVDEPGASETEDAADFGTAEEEVAAAEEIAPNSVETEAAVEEAPIEPMSAQDFLAQKGIFETTDELIAKIKAMPEGADKEEAKALFEKAVGRELASPAQPIVKSGGRLVRVRKFFGSFHDSIFIEDAQKEWGEARNVSDATLEILRSEYPQAEIEVSE